MLAVTSPSIASLGLNQPISFPKCSEKKSLFSCNVIPQNVNIRKMSQIISSHLREEKPAIFRRFDLLNYVWTLTFPFSYILFLYAMHKSVSKWLYLNKKKSLAEIVWERKLITHTNFLNFHENKKHWKEEPKIHQTSFLKQHENYIIIFNKNRKFLQSSHFASIYSYFVSSKLMLNMFDLYFLYSNQTVNELPME